ncbi:MAG TPA: hypothetical protein VEZ59_12250 [Sphingopyxis sp.]|nr:hypothetical protein [Sphingopyxis sp.]
MLGELQRLQLARSQALLTDAVDALAHARASTAAGRDALAQVERDFDIMLARASFDPEAMRRAGMGILIAEDVLAGHAATEAQAAANEGAARHEWHSDRQRSDVIDARRCRLTRKLAQVTEDKAAIDLVSLAATSRKMR